MGVPDLGNASFVAMDRVTLDLRGEWQLHHNNQKRVVLRRKEKVSEHLITCALVYIWFLSYIQILLLLN